MTDVFKRYDTNVRMPYDSKKFVLPVLMADLTLTLELDFPDVQFSFSEVLMLAMVQYLSECLCELMEVRDFELEEVLRLRRRKSAGEWEAERNDDKSLKERVLRSVEVLRETETEESEKEDAPLTDEELRTEVERLRETLAEKEAALAEEGQKVIQQRVLYEKARDERDKLSKMIEDSAVEHAELIALREYVYNSRNALEEEEALDEESREEIIGRIGDKKAAVLGGSERWIKRMKRILPKWSFISVEDDSIGGVNALERADFIYIYTSCLKHKQYYRAMNLIKSTGKMLFYLGSTNTDECLRQFGRELGN